MPALAVSWKPAVQWTNSQLLKVTTIRYSSCPRSILITILTASAFAAIAPALAGARQIPALTWSKRSDWIDLRTDIKPAAVGDGKADDTAAIQQAFNHIRDGAVLYLPPGSYRITSTLRLHNSGQIRWSGGLLVGCGRDTRLVWDGPAGAPMFLLNGMAHTRFVGFELDGRGKACVGFHYQATQGFQTEVTHRHLAFRGFTDAAILEQHPDSGQALAETTFENCLFEDCGRGVAFLQFNDYDYTFDGCEFRRCGVAVDCAHGNFYVRNCHFEHSRIADIRDLSEHGSSVRRCTSTGSNVFIMRTSIVAPLSVQDCRVDGWKSADGAIVLSGPPVLLFDCVFTHPPRDRSGVAAAPIRAPSPDSLLIVSGNQVEGAAGLVQAGNRPRLWDIPSGQRKGSLRSAERLFLQETVRVPPRVFEARRDFGAKGDGVNDDTQAIQQTIHAAAAASGGALAYLPTGTYVIKSTLRMTGRDYVVGGSGWSTRLLWKGPAEGTMLEVRSPQHVVLEDLLIGSHDAGPMNNAIDIHQLGSDGPSHMTYDGVYVFGAFHKEPFRKGLVFSGLSAKDVVVLPHVQGNLRFTDCGRATVLANCSYYGSLVLSGKEKQRGGLLGFQTRLATTAAYCLYLRDNQNVVISDFYIEQADNGFRFEGSAAEPPGRATIGGAKFHVFASDDPQKSNILDIRGYRGELFVGPYQFNTEPKRMRIRQQDGGPLGLFLLGCSWYDTQPDVKLGTGGKLVVVGNEAYGKARESQSAAEAAFFRSQPSAADLAKISRALDDLRRLGEYDLRFNHPQGGQP